jgi:hypothetical protein
MSAEVAEDDRKQRNPRSNPLPTYLERRKAEVHQLRQVIEQSIAVEEAENSFPRGREPLNAAATERTREFLEDRVAELTKAIASFPFTASNSITGRERKGRLEEQLREAEAALRPFQYPVVFVKSSRPQIVKETKPVRRWR